MTKKTFFGKEGQQPFDKLYEKAKQESIEKRFEEAHARMDEFQHAIADYRHNVEHAVTVLEQKKQELSDLLEREKNPNLAGEDLDFAIAQAKVDIDYLSEQLAIENPSQRLAEAEKKYEELQNLLK